MTKPRRTRAGQHWSTARILLLALALVAALGFSHSNANSRALGPPPSGNLEMLGEYGSVSPVDDPTHDPALIHAPEEQTYYVFATGIARTPDDPGGIFVRRSKGNLAGPWESMGEIAVPEWTLAYGHGHLWAPAIVRVGTTYWMYYSASTWGSQNSGIGVMSTTTPGDLDSWVDHGPVLTSQSSGPRSPYNAIDPYVFEDEGTWWMVFGSYQQGIFLYEMSDMATITGDPIRLAGRPVAGQGFNRANVEGPAIFKRDGYYYLLVSRDLAVTDRYFMSVGRSENLTGPYVNENGQSMLTAEGKLLLAPYDEQQGLGGGEVVFDRGRHYLVHHYYEWPLQIRMQIRELQWEDGWPYILDHRYD